MQGIWWIVSYWLVTSSLVRNLRSRIPWGNQASAPQLEKYMHVMKNEDPALHENPGLGLHLTSLEFPYPQTFILKKIVSWLGY